MEYGIVYLLTNPAMPDLVKIGMTTQEDIDKRMKKLFTTGVPLPFECQYARKVTAPRLRKPCTRLLHHSASLLTASSSAYRWNRPRPFLNYSTIPT